MKKQKRKRVFIADDIKSAKLFIHKLGMKCNPKPVNGGEKYLIPKTY